MRIPLSWLQTFFDEPLLPTEDLIRIFSDLGLSPEEVLTFPGPLAGVKTARVVSLEPLGDHLQDTVVTHGDTEYRLVCGAPNIAVGQIVAHVLPGTTLPVGEIGEREIHGVKSHGMLASPIELGLFDYGGGLLLLPNGTPLGEDLADFWPAEEVIVLEVTPNRADAFSMLGVARDLAAKLELPLRAVAPEAQDLPVDDSVVITVEDEAGGHNGFSGRVIDNVRVEPSPIWLQRHLAAVGQRPINNVVDVTNYVMFELGQPMHAYDVSMLEKTENGLPHVGMRRAQSGEKLTLLNDDKIELSTDDLVIYTGQQSGRPVGLAGVMGGKGDSVEESTQSILLEVASFDHVLIRLNGKRHKLISEARTRFERGVDPNIPASASQRATDLLEQIAGGTARPSFTWHKADATREPISFRPERVKFLTDVHVPEDVQQGILERLGCIVERGDTWTVTPPTWRFDMTIEEDVVEEVIRLFGYEHIGITRPTMLFTPSGSDPTFFQLRTDLVAMGFQELISYVFTGPEYLNKSYAPDAAVTLLEPQGIERSVLRTALHPSLIEAAYVNRREKQLALFEIGRVFLNDREEERLGLLLSGERFGNGWGAKVPADFYTLKGVLERIARELGVDCTVETMDAPHLHPGVSGAVLWDGEVIGTIGQLHPTIAAEFELPPTWVAEVRLPLAGNNLTFTDIVRQPYNERDLAIIIPRDVTFGEIAALCKTHGGDKLETVEPFDVFESDRLGEGKKSLAVRLRFRDLAAALRDEEVDGYVASILEALQERGYEIRS